MSGIKGAVRETTGSDFSRLIGVFTGEVVAINPTSEQYKNILGWEVEDDKIEYLGQNRDGHDTLRVDVWLKITNGGIAKGKFVKATYYLENRIRENKDFTKTQFINNIGTTSWADEESNLPAWFHKRPFREAHVGEEEFYNFLRNWLSKLDYKSEDTELQLDWKKLMKGNVKDLKDQIGGEYSSEVLMMATVIQKDGDDGETKFYQGIYNKAVIPAYYLKMFKNVDYSQEDEQAKILEKQPKDQKPYEKFVASIIGEYGCNNIYSLKEIEEFDAEKHFIAEEKEDPTGSSY